jgi:hypothetical protein
MNDDSNMSPGFKAIVTGDLEKEKRMRCRCLVVFAHGQGLVILCESGIPLDYLHDNGSGAGQDGFVLDNENVDYEKQPDGVYVGVLSLHVVGPGDWPGTYEHEPWLRDVRPITAEEWSYHLGGEWPWDEVDRDQESKDHG